MFRRAFDVGSCKVVDTIDDKIAAVDGTFSFPSFDIPPLVISSYLDYLFTSYAVENIFNKGGSKKEEATTVQKTEADVNGTPDSLKPNGLSACGSVRKTEDNTVQSSDCRESSRGCEEGKEKGQSKLATKITTLAEEKSNKDSCEASGSRGNQCDGKAQESEVKKQFSKQKSMPAEERYGKSCEASGSGVNQSSSKKVQVNGVEKQLTKQKSMPADERYSRESNGLDDRPQKKQKVDGSVRVPDGRNTNVSQNIRSDGKRDAESFKRPRDKVAGDDVPPEKPGFVTKKRDVGVSVSEGKHAKVATDKGLSKKPSFDGKLLKRGEDKVLADDYARKYQVIEVNQRPNSVSLDLFVCCGVVVIFCRSSHYISTSYNNACICKHGGSSNRFLFPFH